MSTRTRNLRPPVISILVVLLMTLSFAFSFAQPGDTVYPHPPDYDQVREGLPETDGGTPGGAYCGPTSSADILKWLNDNGFPLLGDWGESTAEVTAGIYAVGEAMNTGANNGTTVSELLDGFQSLADAVYPLQFWVAYYGRNGYDDPYLDSYGRKFSNIAQFLDDGALVIARIGWYHLNPPAPSGFGLRCNGHYVAVTGYDQVAGEDWVRFLDPARDTDCVAGYTICVARWRTTLETLTLEDAGSDPATFSSYTASRWQWERSGSDCSHGETRVPVQDGFHLITEGRCYTLPDRPEFYLTEVNLARMIDGQWSVGGSDIASMAVNPFLKRVYYCDPNADRIFSTHLVTDTVEEFNTSVPLFRPRQLAFGRAGTLYVLHAPPPRPPGGRVPTAEPGAADTGLQLLALAPDGSLRAATDLSGEGAFTYHEKTNRVYWWDGSANRLQAFTADLDSVGQGVALPPVGNFAPPAYVAVEPNGDLLCFNHDGSAAIHRYDLASHTAATPIADQELTDPAAMVLNDSGHLLVVQQHFAPLLHFDAQGVRLLDTPVQGVSGRAALALNRPPRPLPNLPTTPGDLDNDPPLVSVSGVAHEDPSGGLLNLRSTPNPFNARTTIAFELRHPESVSLRIYDVTGRLVRTLIDGEPLDRGRHTEVWTGRDDGGRHLASGTYFYRLEAGVHSGTRRMVLVK